MLRWRFEHEDESDERTLMSLNRFEDLTGIQCEHAVSSAIEDWCDDEPGAWNDADLLKVVVLHPPNMAGLYHVSVARLCTATAYRKEHAENE
jgi:hypothetical protein